MAISLFKGNNISLSKEVPGLHTIDIGLGWDARVTDGVAFDLDASAFLLHSDGQAASDANFIFYNNTISPDDAVVHHGDNLSGIGTGDDESISVNLTRVAADIQRIVISVTIHDAETRKQNFGQISNAYIRIINKANDQEIARYDLSEDYSMETTIIFGELYRHNSEWKFRAVGQGFSGGLGVLAQTYGINIS